MFSNTGSGVQIDMTESMKAIVSSFPARSEGWNPIHVYYGNFNHLVRDISPQHDFWFQGVSDRFDKGKKWTSQHGQDLAVARFLNFPRDGYFVDLASNDALWASNTLMFERNFGWRGLCIEGNHYYWYRLAFRVNCTVIGAIVGQQDGEERNIALSFDKGQGPFSGIAGKDFDNKGARNAVLRYTITLETLLRMNNAPKVVDYLSLDIEGAEYFVLERFPFHEYTFKTMTIERPKEQLRKLLEQNGYKLVHRFLGKKRKSFELDTMWAHESYCEQGLANFKKNTENNVSRPGSK
jgi:hypothetical protein